MKVKTSITLSEDVLETIDRLEGEYRSRSELIEKAVVDFLAKLAREREERRDLDILNRRADALNTEAEDVLNYQAPL